MRTTDRTLAPDAPPAVAALTPMGPIEQLRAGRLGLRLPQLLVGLYLFGASLALMVRGSLGVAPWSVLDVGIARRLPLTLGETVIVMSFVVLLLWIPLRERPGLGTVANCFLVGISTDLTLAVLTEPSQWWSRGTLMVGGVLLNAVATALYIGSGFGRGPRDGLMTGLVRRTGWSVRLVRTSIEVTVVVLGWLVGGPVGAGTLLYALGIGPLVQLLLPWCSVPLTPRATRATRPARASRAR